MSNGPCQYCMSGSSAGSQRALLILVNGQWQPWPLVAAKPDVPTLLCEICPVCDRENFNVEEVPRLNAKIAALPNPAPTGSET